MKRAHEKLDKAKEEKQAALESQYGGKKKGGRLSSAVGKSPNV